MDLDGRVAVVTGGASGMGAAIVTLLHHAGARPIVWDVAPAADVACDVADPAAVDAALAATIERAGVPTVVTVCAGVGSSSLLVDTTPEEWDRVLAVNLRGAFLTIRATARVMIEHAVEGSIVVFSSISAHLADRGMGAYCASKAGLDMLVAVAAAELGPHGIRVNAVSPGVTRTPMLDGAAAIPGWTDEVSARTALGRIGEPDEVADVALALHRLDWLTGACVPADGGLRLQSPIDSFGSVAALRTGSRRPDPVPGSADHGRDQV